MFTTEQFDISEKNVVEIQKILSHTRRACEHYDLIDDGDVIAVGISGGKDSLALLLALDEMRRFYPKKYELIGVTVDIGAPGMDFSEVAKLCEKRGIKYHIEKTQIYEVVFDVRKESNPCSLCSKMRRGVLHEAAKACGANKIALGHHNDDVVETFMLNLFYEGRVGCFQPKTYLSRTDVTVIRPFVYLEEKEIKSFCRKVPLPVVESTCPADKDSKRADMKELLYKLDKENRGLRTRIFGAVCRGEIDGFKEIKGR
ncbi:MAG: tRNA 2-thiocytidine(32) synthetase TtcA [Clostridia bacterium]|nr:tRNA 2-thiocytidine(32) synthetase TtcA [Clostridia bacterium]